MLLVVYAHVMHFSLNMRDVASSFISLFRMPTFFFVSGYIAYKAVECWDSKFFCARLKKKAIVQIIPAVVFFTLFSLVHYLNPVSEFARIGFGKFWFTIALFEMFCIYFILSRLGNALGEWITDAGLIIVALAGVVYFYFFNVLGSDKFLIFQVANYFQFFVFGLMCRKHSRGFLGLMDYTRVRAGIILVFLLSAVAYAYYWYNNLGKSPHAALYQLGFGIIDAYIGVIALFAVFRSCASFFDSTSLVSNVFSFVGRRTLDIYLLHYFFLPDLSCVATWLASHSNTLLNFFVSASIALLVTAVSLLASRIIRISDFLAQYLFGASPPSRAA